MFWLMLLFIVILPITGSVAQTQDPIATLNLEDALRFAASNNFVIKAAQSDFEATRANEITAGLLPNPQFSYLSEQIGEPVKNTIQYTAAVGQTFETGGKRQRRLDSARAATTVARHTLAGIEQQINFQVKKNFNDVLTAKATLELAEQNLKAIEDVEKIQSIRAAKGDLSELELLRIQVQQYAFQRDAADARQALQAAKIALRTVVGPDLIAENYDVVGKLDYRELPFNRPDLFELARVNRPDLRAADAARDKAQADIKLAEANAWWDVTPLLEYKRDGKFDTFGAGVSIPIRLFDRNQGEIVRAGAASRSAEAVYQAVSAQVLSEVDTALSAIRTEQQKVVNLRDNYLPKAQKARDTIEFVYRRSGTSVLDFLDAQRTYRETSLEYLRSLGNYWTAVYQLELATGSSLVK